MHQLTIPSAMELVFPQYKIAQATPMMAEWKAFKATIPGKVSKWGPFLKSLNATKLQALVAEIPGWSIPSKNKAAMTAAAQSAAGAAPTTPAAPAAPGTPPAPAASGTPPVVPGTPPVPSGPSVPTPGGYGESMGKAQKKQYGRMIAETEKRKKFEDWAKNQIATGALTEDQVDRMREQYHPEYQPEQRAPGYGGVPGYGGAPGYGGGVPGYGGGTQQPSSSGALGGAGLGGTVGGLVGGVPGAIGGAALGAGAGYLYDKARNLGQDYRAFQDFRRSRAADTDEDLTLTAYAGSAANLILGELNK